MTPTPSDSKALLKKQEENRKKREKAKAKKRAAAAAAAAAASPSPSSTGRHVDVRDDLSYLEFTERYRHKRPVLIRGMATPWLATSRWQDVTHLRTLLEKDVLVLRSPDGHTFLKRECKLFDGPFGCVAGTLFDQSRPARPSDRLYARAPLEGGLRAEVSLEGLEALVGGAAGAHRFKAEKCGVWLGSAGCVTPLHFDLWHGFLAGILGTKLFTYLAPEDFRSLYPRPEQPEISKISISLQLDLDAAARLATQLTAGEAGPEAEMLAWHALVRPGDVLYTPPYWWHHVETGADEPALSVLVPFDPTADEALHSCFR